MFCCAGRLLWCHQSGLHHRSQRVSHFSNDRHHHTVSLPVRRSYKLLLNVPASRQSPFSIIWSDKLPPVCHFTPYFLYFIDVLLCFSQLEADFVGADVYLLLLPFSNKMLNCNKVKRLLVTPHSPLTFCFLLTFSPSWDNMPLFFRLSWTCSASLFTWVCLHLTC